MKSVSSEPSKSASASPEVRFKLETHFDFLYLLCVRRKNIFIVSWEQMSITKTLDRDPEPNVEASQLAWITQVLLVKRHQQIDAGCGITWLAAARSPISYFLARLLTLLNQIYFPFPQIFYIMCVCSCVQSASASSKVRQYIKQNFLNEIIFDA